MYTRFTESARKVIEHASSEASRLKKDCVEPEHILLGLFEDRKRMAKVLHDFGVTASFVRSVIGGIQPLGYEVAGLPFKSELPLSEAAQAVIARSKREATFKNLVYVRPQHLLMSLICEAEGVVAEVWRMLGVPLAEMHHAVELWLGPTDRSVEPLQHLRVILLEMGEELAGYESEDIQILPWLYLCAEPYWSRVQEIVADACLEQDRRNRQWRDFGGIFERARKCALGMKHCRVEPLHVLWAMSKLEHSQAAQVLRHFGCTAEKIEAQARERFAVAAEVPETIPYSEPVMWVALRQSERACLRAEVSAVTGTLIDLMDAPGHQVYQFLADLGVPFDQVKEFLKSSRS